MGIWKYLCVLFVACFERKSQNLFLNIAKSCFQADKVRPRRKHRAGGSSSSHGDVHVNPHSVVRWAFQAWRLISPHYPPSCRDVCSKMLKHPPCLFPFPYECHVSCGLLLSSRGMVLAIFKHQSPLKKRHLDLLLQPIVSRYAMETHSSPFLFWWIYPLPSSHVGRLDHQVCSPVQNQRARDLLPGSTASDQGTVECVVSHYSRNG